MNEANSEPVQVICLENEIPVSCDIPS